MSRGYNTLFSVVYFVISPVMASAQNVDTLEDLVQTKIYSASKKEEDLRDSPSAIYVITESDLAQMGVRHVADALRAVPGFQVAKITSNKWMVASRGFGEQFSNKLLVLVDGRPIYTTIFSGVLWYQEDVPIQDIKQIEVIRGPGATVWGSNAVNGVINIITKPTKDTLGTALNVTTGFTEKGKNETVTEVRYGQKIGSIGTARSTLKLRQNPSNESVVNGPNYDDSWKAGALNVRFDSTPDYEKSFKLTASVFKADAEQTYTFPTLAAPYSTRLQGEEASQGGHLLGEWSKELGQDSSYMVRSYVDYNDWHYAGYKTAYLDASLEGQYNFTLFENWEMVSGLGYRVTYDTAENTSYSILSPTSQVAHFVDTFLQAKIPLVEENKVFTTVGTKVESNHYDSLVLSPSIKFSWEPTPLFIAWASWSRANRIPSRNTQNLTTILKGTPGGYIALIPNKDFKSEQVESYEAGTRLNPLHGLQLDTSIFYNRYNNLRTFERGPAMAPPIAVPLYLLNSGEANTKGIEISGTYQTSPDLRLNLAYTYHDLNFILPDGTIDPVFLNSGEKWAKHNWIGRASYFLTDDIIFNASGYYYSSQPAMNMPSYVKVDTNIAWQPMSNTELVLGIDNLMDNLHREYSAPLFGEDTFVPRLYYVTLKVGF